MRVGIHDAEQEYMKNKTFPNYALMKISAYHKAHGNSTEYLARHKEKRLQGATP